jgi:hypothetical protein
MPRTVASAPLTVESFCRMRLNPTEANQIIQDNPAGLSDPEIVETALKTEDYISVLKLVWAERDREKRLRWLREGRKHLFHPLLSLERALAEFTIRPNLETLIHISRPLLGFGLLRNIMDAKCSNNRKAFFSCIQIQKIYCQALDNLTKKHLSKEQLIELRENSKSNQTQSLESLTSLLQEFIQELQDEDLILPKPSWIDEFGSMESEACIIEIKTFFLLDQLQKLQTNLYLLSETE